MAFGCGRKLCGRKQDEEPDELVPLRLEEEKKVQGHETRPQQETRVRPQQKDLFDSIESCDLEHIKKLKGQFSFEDIRDNHERTPLHVLADLKPEQTKGKEKVLKEIFVVLKEAGCDVNSVDEFGNTPVKLAAEKGCIPVLKCLLEEKADVTLPDKHKGDTPIHWSARSGKYEATKLLIEHQPDYVNPQNEDNQTPLHLAVLRGHKMIVDLLLRRHADKNLKDKDGFTPLCFAKRGDNGEIVKLLSKSLREQAQDDQEEYDVPDEKLGALDDRVTAVEEEQKCSQKRVETVEKEQESSQKRVETVEKKVKDITFSTDEEPVECFGILFTPYFDDVPEDIFYIMATYLDDKDISWIKEKPWEPEKFLRKFPKKGCNRKDCLRRLLNALGDFGGAIPDLLQLLSVGKELVTTPLKDNQELKEKTIDIVSKNPDCCWGTLAGHLKVDEEIVKKCREDYSGDTTYKKTSQMLREWIERSDESCTLEIIFEALRLCGYKETGIELATYTTKTCVERRI